LIYLFELSILKIIDLREKMERSEGKIVKSFFIFLCIS